MDTHSLNAFLAVAETGSFSVAAEKLHLTQPAVSKRIAVLEQMLDAKLFDRVGRTISLTEAGKALLPKAYQIISTIADTQREIQNLTGSISGTLTLATSHHIGLHRLPPLLKQFTSQFTDVALDINFIDSEWAYEGIQQGQVELAVITLAPTPTTNVTSEQIWDDPLVFVAASDHPLASETQLELKDLINYSAIFPGSNTFTHHIVKSLFNEAGLNLNIAMATNYLETIKMMVAVGLAWSVLPQAMVDENLRVLPINTLPISRQLGYIHHPERTLSNAAKAFIDLLQAAKGT
ncbi:LysR family transcriptional regulator [Spartinivicinus poritis]|uniref:LysR family transcriptional regulator n=1 Tax=Spartinivicinus poritis TaxID=2994640 RepID=A0ABT5U456_9GAMM|nr:LysR family transcriptional regulator [Spartinivicinus sp. A2-2]MDE1461150.1 LysR family transcriptional regulator [Spartinivicinus sp. A2-2]